ncbi:MULTISPECIES: putative phage tail protein [Aneurinibacillus]|uniref:YmfQ family protein n=1 Tax=Aneurinibacillus thermoaerophilus TaxID=143495 RepID=A0ABX8YD03_ANETH|nr:MULTISPECIES: putative phage tail protein [Aneurinibacillus]AMA74013.1 hypothetical protein ACH33_14980 [Aneurinibacillus sp. XH2]MED0675879.1 DUF2313 domain-containing protein [Aneurinibacillus thermoaerophilus]MED0737213.1 DUF2313 domain-containing protein [Aneurinibacillus thermoaerophilus]QYY43402.1 YmfQ family protein [Aneurinibacillus thermoaerophilus]
MIRIPLKYRQKIPPFVYEDPILAKAFEAIDEEIQLFNKKAQEIVDQYFLSTATWGLPVWEKMFGITDSSGTDEERREKIRRKYWAKRNFTLETLRLVGEQAGHLDAVKEDFMRKIVMFEFFLDKPVHLPSLYKDFEELRPVHVQGAEVILHHQPEVVLIEEYARYHHMDSYICDTFYPEIDAEGRLYHEALDVSEQGRNHRLDFPIIDTFYPEEETR